VYGGRGVHVCVLSRAIGFERRRQREVEKRWSDEKDIGGGVVERQQKDQREGGPLAISDSLLQLK
jgi:hypothetical protein